MSSSSTELGLDRRRLVSQALESVEELRIRGEVAWRSRALFPNPAYDRPPVLVDSWWRQFSALNIRLFVGPNIEEESVTPIERLDHLVSESKALQYPIYAIPDLRSPVLSELVGAGDFSVLGGGQTKPVTAALEAVFAIAPFELLVATPYVLQGIFIDAMSEDGADAAAKKLYDISPLGASFVKDQMVSAGILTPAEARVRSDADFESLLKRYILIERRFRLHFV